MANYSERVEEIRKRHKMLQEEVDTKIMEEEKKREEMEQQQNEIVKQKFIEYILNIIESKTSNGYIVEQIECREERRLKEEVKRKIKKYKDGTPLWLKDSDYEEVYEMVVEYKTTDGERLKDRYPCDSLLSYADNNLRIVYEAITGCSYFESHSLSGLSYYYEYTILNGFLKVSYYVRYYSDNNPTISLEVIPKF